MSARYVLSPEAQADLVDIWEYIKRESSEEVADHVANAILDKIAFLAERPGVGHTRPDLSAKPVKFFTVYSYLIVYRPEATPLQALTVLHGHRDIGRLLR